MDLWSDQCLKKAERMENSHHLVELPRREPLQLQRAYSSHVSKMHCSAAPYDKTDRVCSFQEAATVPPPPREYYYCVFFLAEEVPLPESKGPADLNVCLPLSPLPHEVPLPPSPSPPQTKEKYPDLSNVGFPLDDEVACLMSQPLSVMACEVPLPPSPPPAEAVLHIGDTHEKKYPDLSYIGFPSLDDDTDPQRPNLLPHEVPLPPSPPPVEADLHVGYTDENKYSDLSYIWFPSLDDEMSLSQLAEIPLPPGPPPAEAVLHMGDTHEKKYPDLKNIWFPSLDDEVACLMSQPLSVMACEVPLPSSPPPADAVLDMGNTDEKKYPDLKNIGFPSLDDDVACLMSLSQLASRPPVEIPHLAEKKYLNLSIVAFPCLDDDI